jgi:hypothetical protein
MTCKHKQFVDQIINMIFSNEDSFERIAFAEKSHKIGKDIYAISGYKGLYIVMDLVQQELVECEYSDEYLGTLRELEFAFSGICDEWQA